MWHFNDAKKIRNIKLPDHVHKCVSVYWIDNKLLVFMFNYHLKKHLLCATYVLLPTLLRIEPIRNITYIEQSDIPCLHQFLKLYKIDRQEPKFSSVF